MTNDYLNYASYQMSKGTITISLIYAILVIVGLWMMFTKAQQPGWASIIPFYNTYTLCKIATGNGWLFLLLLIPCVNIVVYIIVSVKLAAAFGKGTFFMIMMLLFPGICYLILGFGSSQYRGPQ